jgi:hypothetical protein
MSEFVPQESVTPSEYPGEQIPTIFADGVANIANTGQIAKFYLFRFDPSLQHPSRARPTAAAQIVVSLDGLVNMMTFLEQAVAKLVQQGIILQSVVDAARQSQK